MEVIVEWKEVKISMLLEGNLNLNKPLMRNQQIEQNIKSRRNPPHHQRIWKMSWRHPINQPRKRQREQPPVLWTSRVARTSWNRHRWEQNKFILVTILWRLLTNSLPSLIARAISVLSLTSRKRLVLCKDSWKEWPRFATLSWSSHNIAFLGERLTRASNKAGRDARLEWKSTLSANSQRGCGCPFFSAIKGSLSQLDGRGTVGIVLN